MADDVTSVAESRQSPGCRPARCMRLSEPGVIDQCARVMFPLVFVLFNLVYWFAYYNVHGHPDEEGFTGVKWKWGGTGKRGSRRGDAVSNWASWSSLVEFCGNIMYDVEETKRIQMWINGIDAWVGTGAGLTKPLRLTKARLSESSWLVHTTNALVSQGPYAWSPNSLSIANGTISPHLLTLAYRYVSAIVPLTSLSVLHAYGPRSSSFSKAQGLHNTGHWTLGLRLVIIMILSTSVAGVVMIADREVSYCNNIAHFVQSEYFC